MENTKCFCEGNVREEGKTFHLSDFFKSQRGEQGTTVKSLSRKGLPTHPLEMPQARELKGGCCCHFLPGVTMPFSRGSGRKHQKREADKLAMTALNTLFVWGSCAREWPCMCIHVPRTRKIIFSVEQDLKQRRNRTSVKQSNSCHLQ